MKKLYLLILCITLTICVHAEDNYDVETFLNDQVSTVDGLYRNFRAYSPLQVEGYKIASMDVNVGGTSYYAYENKGGEYYIMKSIESGVVTSFTFTSGSSGLSTTWANRATETYGSYGDTF